MNNKHNDMLTQRAYAKIVEFYKGDKQMANRWFNTRNRFLNGRTPMQMIGDHRTFELNQIIDERLRGRK